MTRNYYKASGNFTALSIIYPLAIGAIAIPILSFLYAYFIWYMPFIYLNFLGTILAACGIALISYLTVTFGKNRNPWLAIIIGLILGIYGLFTHWVVWVDLAMNAGKQIGGSTIGITVSSTKNEELIALLTNPDALWGIMKEIAAVGVWGIKGSTVSGGFLWFIWLIEALIIVLAPCAAGYISANEPFDELGNDWSEKKELKVPMEYILDFDTLKSEMENDGYGKLLALSPAHDPQGDHSEWSFYESKASQQYYVSVDNKTKKVDDKGNITHSSTHSIQYLDINPTVAEAFMRKMGLV